MKLNERARIEKAMDTLFKCGLCGEDERMGDSRHFGGLRVCERCIEKWHTINIKVLPINPLQFRSIFKIIKGEKKNEA